MIDLTSYDKKDILYLLKHNPKIRTAIFTTTDWEGISNAINAVGIKLTSEQIEYIKYKLS